MYQSNYLLQFTFKTLVNLRFNIDERTVSIVFGALLCVAVGVITYVLVLYKKECKKTKANNDEIEKLNCKINELIQKLQTSQNYINKHKTDYKNLLDRFSLVEQQLTKAQSKVSKLIKEQAPDPTSTEKTTKITATPSKHEIEEYLPEIDKIIKYAESCKYNSDDPEGSFLTQNQQLDAIKRVLASYKSQRK